MQAKSITIRNFRAIRDITVALGPQIAIVGGNGCGKSTVLRAMEKFYGQQSYLEADDHFDRDVTQPVEIEITFHKFSEDERAMFASRIHADTMIVTRVFEAGSGRGNGKYFGSTLRNPDFNAVREADGAAQKRTVYNQLRARQGYANLPAVSRADQVEPALEAWEAEHPDACFIGRDDGQFFGFTNVAKGALQKHTSFVFVPAVRDVSADAVDAKGAVIARLMELVVRSAIQRRAEIRAFQAQTSAQFRQLTDPANLPELGALSDVLSATLKLFYADSAVDLRWKPTDDLVLPLPAAEVSLDEDGFQGPVDRKGHGLQRAFVLTLLQHLAGASAAEQALRQDESGQVSEPPAAAPDGPAMPGLILAIEEPELYQHPTKQRHFARVLTSLSSGSVPGVAGTTQILFASHSALFISMDRFDEIRIARRVESDRPPLKMCEITEAKLATVAAELERVHERQPGTFTPEGLRARLHTIGSELAEGFFADLVVLVEGASDKAAIFATAERMGLSLEGRGIAVLAVDGKSNMDRPALIFRELGIPCYLVWDCDRNERDAVKLANSERESRLICRICNVEPAIYESTRVGENYAAFQDKLETTLKEEIGAGVFAEELAAVKEHFGVAKDRDALKTPSVLADVLRRCEERGNVSATLVELVRAVFALRDRT